MYSHIAGAGVAAGAPTLLVATGLAGPQLGIVLASALGAIAMGIAMLRVAHRRG
mgnify:CR=1 FL=1